MKEKSGVAEAIKFERKRSCPMQKPVIVRDPDILDGEPVFQGTRVPFRNLVDYLNGGDSLDEFIEGFDIERETAIQALEEMNRTDLLRLVARG